MPSYRGLNTDAESDRNYNGIEGYYGSCNGGHRSYGTHNLLKIKQFFADAEISLENWKPNDSLSGSNPLLVKSMIFNDASQCIAYIANPESYAGHSPNGYEGMQSDQISDTSQTYTIFTLELPFSSGKISWFNPSTGEWNGSAEITKNSTTLLTPTTGDWRLATGWFWQNADSQFGSTHSNRQRRQACFSQAMEKTTLICAIIAQLESDLDQASGAALESAESATHEEARAESKYDTRGLETSYLASGQARHALELKKSLDAIRNFTLPTFDSSNPIALGAIVTTLSSNGRETFFLVPGIGGIKLETEQGLLTVITSKSPIGSELIGKRTGDRIQAGGGKSIIRIS